MEAVPSAPAEERKVATVLFADLVSSTELGEQDPERTRAVLDRFYEAMAAEIEAAGGTVEKFAGDAVMAAFGAPAALEDHAERALHAALAMLRRLEPPLRLRIGVNTGEVVVGRAREGSSFVTGDAVNVAARLEQAAAPGEILAGERTVAAARGAFEFDEPQTVQAKGKRDGVICRRVVRALTLMRPRGVGGLHEAFVGREREVELLLATYRRAVERREPHLVTIMGDAGVGKTRLVRELWADLQDESPAPMRRTGRCLSYGRGITYWPLAEVIKEHFGIAEGEEPDRVLAALAGREVLGLALGLDVTAGVHPLVARDRLHEAAASFLQELASERPLVLLIEDLHWAEEELLDLVDRLLADVAGPLFLIATSRPEILDVRPAWGGGKRNVTLLGLEPLTERQTEEMVGGLLASDLPERVREALIERAGGNPFFVEELVSTLIDHGVLARDNGGWAARELPEGFEIPDSVQGVLAARIDLLPTAEKAGLQAAAVVGRTFWPSAVSQLLEGHEPSYELLEERDFIRRRAGSSLPGDREYAIKHALTREVAYASLPKARRARLHAALAQWMESSHVARDEFAALLGHHYAESVKAEDADLAWADDPEELARLQAKALHWLERAGDLAAARYEIDDAIALFRRAIDLTGDPALQAGLWQKTGRAYALKYDGPAFWSAMERSLELTSDPQAQAAVYSELAFHTSLRYGMWKRAPDRGLIKSWIDRALESAQPGSRERARALLAGTFSGERPVEEVLEATELADELGIPELRVVARQARAITSHRAGEYDQALDWARSSFELLPQISDPEMEVESYETLLPPLIAHGRFGEAEEVAIAHDELCKRLTPHHRVHGIGVRVELDELLGRWDAIAGRRERIRADVAANLNTPCVRNPRTLLSCALAHELLGDAEEAVRLEAEAEELAMEGYPFILAPPRIRLSGARGDLDRVGDIVRGIPTHMYWFGYNWRVARLDACAALGERETVEREAAETSEENRLLWPFALRALGQVREDETLIRQALERFEAMGLDWHAEQTRALL